jgi:hypothetical protein
VTGLIRVGSASLSGLQNALTEEGKTASAKHGRLISFSFVIWPSVCPLLDFLALGRFHRSPIPLDSSGKRTQFWDRTGEGNRQPGRESLYVFFSHQWNQCLSQGQCRCDIQRSTFGRLVVGSRYPAQSRLWDAERALG